MMAIGRMSGVRELNRYLTIAVDSYDDWDIGGVIFQGDSFKGVRFCSFAEMMINMDRLFDSVGAPKQTFQMRNLPGTTSEAFQMRSIKTAEKKGKLHTIHIYLRFRYHASWQGTMLWDDGKQKQQFESELQFILLTDAILKGCTEGKTVDLQKALSHPAVSSDEFFNVSGKYMELCMTDDTENAFGLNFSRIISHKAADTLKQNGQKASFSLKVMFLEHFTWQGILYWREGKVQLPFRSFKEMIYMISSVVETTLTDG
ncbi:hypothetical protein [Lacrimispora sp. JR3]|uniref:hypothetical protein n=1 Tax=Lacrimispora sinapis TaxID=3111456 RepID=UPI003749F4E4